eukprot:CAMPEP_0197191986 /NCGR_PEP_ID=MMETSP1423-20130617/24345_1 /TAXON_ID=476441 /ORGANISM="Pseudo-nitzschia heimii, Strain UNC1101" /LENGTH=732 /DNA_ID=CAMNT_0042644787 /DNA_START=264 /DNA_END=2462 /DNA_ORIENTATION=-
MISRFTRQKVDPPNVVAPWTTLVKKKNDDIEPRSFVFAENKKLDSEYGVPQTGIDRKEDEKIRKDALRRLCAKSKKFSQNAQPALRCKQSLELLRCVSCSERDGVWYTAVGETGSVFGKVFNGTSLRFPNFNDGPFLYQQLDIAVPIAGQDEKLRRFAAKLGHSIKKFRSGIFGAKVAIRLLVSRFSFDSPSIGTSELEEFRLHLSELACLVDPADDVKFVEVTETTEFNRAKAVNALHDEADHSDNTAMAMIDVDLSIESKFLRNALTYPFPNASAYFPIMFSQFDPDSVKLVDQFIPRNKRYSFSEHHGHWRKFSFGMYVLAGSDVARLSMDENFVGWGGEDNDFFSRVSSNLNIIRLHDPGLTHVWHSKNCDLGAFVEKKYYTACVGSMAHFEGSQLGMYLKNLRANDRASFDQIMISAKDKENKIYSNSADLIVKEIGEKLNETPTILVGVISSRANFGIRVKSIVDTWGQPQNVPEGVLVRFFVGAQPNESSFPIKSKEHDRADLAKSAGIKDLSQIVVMDEVIDDEYPPVHKNTAMIEYLNNISETFENDVDAPSTFQWIYKVDDDAYVNFDAMLSFLRSRSTEGHHIYGERGTGRKEDTEGLKHGGLVKPYCTGGPGYIMSRQIVKKTAPNLKNCVAEFDKSRYREFLWHSDSVIGLCIYKSTGAGCWDDSDYYTHRYFRHNLKKEDPFIASSDLENVIATHPFKDYVSMEKQHMRYVELASIHL